MTQTIPSYLITFILEKHFFNNQEHNIYKVQIPKLFNYIRITWTENLSLLVFDKFNRVALCWKNVYLTHNPSYLTYLFHEGTAKEMLTFLKYTGVSFFLKMERNIDVIFMAIWLSGNCNSVKFATSPKSCDF